MRWFPALLVGSILVAHTALAAYFVIDDASVEGSITISLNDFEAGFYVNGTLIQHGLSNPASVTVSEAGPVMFSGSWIDLGESTPGSRTIYLVESANPTLVSDIFQFTVSTSGGFGTIQGSFQSDTSPGSLGTLPTGVNPADVFVENGDAVPFSAPYLGGEIISDNPEVEEATPTVTLTAPPTATPTVTLTATPTNTLASLGAACNAPGECQSGFCASGVCCNTACDQPFQQCNLPGRAGLCSSTGVPAPAMSRPGLLLGVLLLTGVGVLALARRRITSSGERFR